MEVHIAYILLSASSDGTIKIIRNTLGNPYNYAHLASETNYTIKKQKVQVKKLNKKNYTTEIIVESRQAHFINVPSRND